MRKIPSLFEHQQKTVAFAQSTPYLLDFSDPGTGKTCSALTIFRNRWMTDKRSALVLAPKSILKSAWGNDITTFTPDLTYSIAYASNRAEAFAKQADIYITNIDATVWLVKQPKEFFEKFSTLIIDEGTFYKHHTSARSKAAAKIAKYFDYRELMTGTPNSNTILDVWHQVYIVDGGTRLGSSFFGFRNTACTPKQVGPGASMIKWTDRPGIHEAVASILSDISIRHCFEDCTDIPANYKYNVDFELNPKHRAKYTELKKDSILELKNGDVTAIHAASLATKLLQVASGAVYGSMIDKSKGENYHLIDTDRYELIIDLVLQRSHSIVFFLWAHQKEELIKHAKASKLSYAVIDGSVTDTHREEIVARYQKGDFQVLFAHPATTAHGLTLVKGTATIWSSPPHNLDWFTQGNRRVYRTGQTQKTETIVVLAKDTIEEKVLESLHNKDVNMQTLLGLLK